MRVIGNNPDADNAEITAVASGTLPSGKTVVVNADGTVSTIAAVSASTGSAAVYETEETAWNTAVFDSSNNKVVVVYRTYNGGGGNELMEYVVGTVSGSSISFSSPATAYDGDPNNIDSVFDSANNRIVVSFGNDSDSGKGYAIVGSLSGTTVTWGTATKFEDGDTNFGKICFDSTANKVVIAYRDQSNSQYGTAVVGTISGTSISFGSPVVFESASTVYYGIAYDSNANKTVISYKDAGNSNYGTAIVGTISGTGISFGSPVVFEEAQTNFSDAVFDPSSNKIVIAYQDAGDGDAGKAIIGTVSGTSISFGNPVEFSANTRDYSTVFDSSANKVIISYKNLGNSNYGTVISGSVSGTSIAFDSEVVFEAATTNYIGMCFDSNANKSVVAYTDAGNGGDGTAITFTSSSTNLTSENFIGFSPGSVGIESRTQAVGSETVFEAASSTQFGSTFDTSNNKVVFSYTDAGNSNKGTAIVGTISDTSISFGSAVEFEQGSTQSHAATFDTNSNKVVLAYRDRGNSDYGTAIVGTVSGTNISFGSAVAFVSSNSDYIRIVFDSNSNKVVISYVDLGDSNKGKAIVGTVSGTNISFGSATEFESGSTQLFKNPAFDSLNNKIVIPYKDLGNSNYGTAVVGTVNGTSISFGTPVVFAQGETRDIGIDFDTTNNKVVIAYKNESGSNYGTSIVGTVSGTSISFGTAVVYQSSDSRNNNVTFDPSAQTSTITYKNQASSEVGQFVVGTISGTSISFTSATTFTGSNSAFFLSTTLDSNSNRLATAFYDQSNSNYGTSVILKTAFTTITRDEVASGSNAVINIGSAISTNQLSLTAGQQYFVQTDGTLGLTADDPSVIAGTAISATEIIVKG